MECMESADIFKKDTIFKDFLALNVHENANKELSSNSGHLDWKVRKIGTFQSFFLLREIVLRLILKHFPHIP